ncbi:MAG: branched-chain amino acid ABC transporter permease [Rhodobacterales bacterium]|uniref:branched-chain amino acid ABC transporter permease n=1 Tax=Sulfitobacter sp. HI0054 TaxID=1822238 RepID=UPI0007C28AE1|nr:branched-chain amino acid ABC transporter permease [Sulfitobacter sp. HI0054]KZY53191.1 ABC transporter permease [Sulfitobacter sp. HI0054]MDX5411436.1 branched-chain amino acid ABC transporter permease [Rhodobacterales bacterium]
MAATDLGKIDSRPSPLRLIPAAILLVAVLALAAAPWWAGRADLRLLMEALAYLALAQMWNLLAGYTGLVSVGQQAYVGLGGYLFFALTIFAGVPVIPAMALAALITALIAIPTGWIAFRLNGAYFAIGTWVIAEVFRLVAAQVAALGGGSGISLPVGIVRALGDRAAIEMTMYYMAFFIGISSVLFVWLLLRSRWGLALTAIRDSELAAETLGVNTRRVKFLIYVITAGFTALAGSFIFLQKLRITPDAAFSLNDWTAFVIFIVVIGGIGTIEGPILGVIVFFALREVAADWGTWYLMLMGGIAIAVMLIDKRGLYGWLKHRLGLVLLPTNRTLD